LSQIWCERKKEGELVLQKSIRVSAKNQWTIRKNTTSPLLAIFTPNKEVSSEPAMLPSEYHPLFFDSEGCKKDILLTAGNSLLA